VAGIVKSVAALTDVGKENMGQGGAHVDEQMTSGDSAFAWDPPVEAEITPSHDITVCDVALMSRRTGAIDHGAICGLLTECL
jgi:hypothetical protein